MNYIIFDTEFNQPTFFGKKKFIPNPVAPFEIIELGAVKVDEDLNITDTFGMLIKPEIYRMLSPIVTRKTKIRKEDLKQGFSFPHVFKAFKKWVGKDYMLCSWGDSDINELKRNCKFHQINDMSFNKFMDLQKLYMYKHNVPAGQQSGLKTAMDEYAVPVEGRPHRALNDALYTAAVFQKMFDEDLIKAFQECEHNKVIKNNKSRTFRKKFSKANRRRSFVLK